MSQLGSRRFCYIWRMSDLRLTSEVPGPRLTVSTSVSRPVTDFSQFGAAPFIYSGQDGDTTPDPEDPPGRGLADNWVAPAHSNVGCWPQKRTSPGQFCMSLNDP
jgi:hypothetical protein